MKNKKHKLEIDKGMVFKLSKWRLRIVFKFGWSIRLFKVNRNYIPKYSKPTRPTKQIKRSITYMTPAELGRLSEELKQKELKRNTK
jgi:hypothetical protein